MGQSPQTGLNQTSFFKTFKSQFRPIEVSGERVDGQVYVCDTNQEMIIEIANRILDQESDEQFHNQQNMIQSIQSLYIINYYGSAQKQSQEMCSSYSLILSYYEFVQHNLFKEIYSRKENQEQFSEREIWYLLWSLTVALWELKQKGYNHKDLRPQTVALKNGIIKLCPIGVLQDQKNSVIRFVVDNQQTYLPPLLRKQLTNNSQPQLNWNRIDSFAVGHIVLDLMLVDMPVIIDNQQCNNLLKICYNRYSNQLIRVTEKLINDQLQIEDVYYLLKPYSLKIMALQEFRINYEDVKQQAIPLNNISKLNLKSLSESLSSQEQRQVVLNHQENMQSEYLQDTRLIQKQVNQHELSEQQIQEQISIEQQQRQQQILHQMQVQQQQQQLKFNQNKQQFNQANEIQLQHQIIQQNEQKYIEQQNFQQQQFIQEQQFLRQQQLQLNQQQQVNNQLQVNNQQNIQMQHVAIQQQQINEQNVNYRVKQIEPEQNQQIYQQQLPQEQQLLQIQQQQEWLLKQQQIQQQQAINQQVQQQQPLQQQVILRMSQQNQNLVQSPQIRQSVSPPPQQIVTQQQPQQLLQRLLVQSQQIPPQTQQQQIVQYYPPQIQPSIQQSPINQIKIQQQQSPPINIITNIPPQQIIQQPTIGVQRPPQPPIFPIITQSRPPINYVNQTTPPGVRIPVQIAQTVSPIKGDLEREITVLEYKQPQNQLLKASNQIPQPYDSNQKKQQISANNFDRIRNVIQDSDELLQHK